MKGNPLPEERQVAVMLGYLCVANEREANLVNKVKVLDRFGLSDREIALRL